MNGTHTPLHQGLYGRACSAAEVLFIERRLPWRVENWLSQQPLAQSLKARRRARWERMLFRTLVSPGDLVIDVGANVGTTAAAFLDCGARVVCVEPNGESVERLVGRFADNTRVSIVAAGLGPEPGISEFHRSPDTERSTFVLDRMKALGDSCVWNEAELIPITTLDTLLSEFGVLRFCKIDVEGYEPEVLRGLTRPVPGLSFEFHGELFSDLEFCVDYLDRLGMSSFNVLLYPVGGHRLYHPLSRLFLSRHVSKNQLLDVLNALRHNPLAGDVYAFGPDGTNHGATA
jgi:FkbM family methyltransferase